jgi:hypothetical protein
MNEPLFLLVGDPPGRAFDNLRGKALRTADDVRLAFASSRKGRWVAGRSGLRLLHVARTEKHETWHRILTLEELDTPRRELLGALFRVVVAPGGGTKLLPAEDLAEVLAAEDPEDYFVGGVVDREDHALVLYRGNFERLVLPLSWFHAQHRGTKPDFDDFEVVDGGQTVRLGRYEAATDAILYEHDPASRRRMKQRELTADRTFGGALRRLRLQKRLGRADFGAVNEKTVGRIERGEVVKPHARTLAVIARRLGIEPGEIQTF